MKIINIMPHVPAYEALSVKKHPIVKWRGADGREVCIVNHEWPGSMGHWVRQVSKSISWEVWQPDYRAKKNYSYKFDDGVVHRLFPAKERTYYWGGLRPFRSFFSDKIIDLIKEIHNKNDIVILHGFGLPYWFYILKQLKDNDHAPILLIDHGTALSPLQRISSSRHPLSLIACFVEQFRMRKYYSSINGIYGPNETTLSAVKSVYKGTTGLLNMGCDFDFWKPVLNQNQKKRFRSEFGIANDVIVFIDVALYRPSKQLDKLISAFHSVELKKKWILLAVGYGDPNYLKYLKELVRSFKLNNKIRFMNYVSDEKLHRLYCASDVFISSSVTEGASVSIMEAIACGLPVISTPVGGTYEIMHRNGVGRWLSLKDDKSWPSVIQYVIDNGLPDKLNHHIAKNNFDWYSVASKIIKLLNNVINN